MSTQVYPNYQATNNAPSAYVKPQADPNSYMPENMQNVAIDVKEKADEANVEVRKGLDRFFYPTGVSENAKPFVIWFGRIGWVAKAIVYATIGVLAVKAAADGTQPEGPRGAFLLVGNTGAGKAPLIVMFCALFFYVIWRFWEAATGQGSDKEFSKHKNFFKYRLSPFVSGIIYTAYMVYLGQLITDTAKQADASWPGSYSSTAWGRFVLAFIGITFLIACLTQVIPCVKGTFEQDLYELQGWERYMVHGAGRIGFGARGFTFLLVAILLFRASNGRQFANGNDPVSDAISQLQSKPYLKWILVVLGIGLLFYAIFACLCTYYKIFPTAPPSRIPVRNKGESAPKDFAAPEKLPASQQAGAANSPRGESA